MALGHSREGESETVRTHADDLVIHQRINTTVDEQFPGILCSGEVWFAIQRNFDVRVSVRRHQLTSIQAEGVRTNAPVEILDKVLDEPQETRRTCCKARLDDYNLVQCPFGKVKDKGDSQLPSAAADARA